MPLVAVVVVTLFTATLAWTPLAHAIPFNLQGSTIDSAVTVGPAVDSVLLDRVRITDNVPVVFDVAAMLPSALRIELKNCVCEGGAQIYVRGYRDGLVTDRSLEVDVSRLSGVYCSLVFVYNLPAYTNVTIRDSRIETPGAMSYFPIPEMSTVRASPLVLYQTSLLYMQLRVNNTVLKTINAGGAAVHIGGGVLFLRSAVVLDGVSLEASGGLSASAMYVPPSMSFGLTNESVFSVTNVSVKSSGGGFVLGDHFTLFHSVLRFAGVEGLVKTQFVRCDGGTIEAGGWLDLYHMWAVTKGSSVASLSAVTLGDGVISFERCIAAGETLASAPSVLGGGVVSVQCNRAGGKMLRSGSDYRMAGLPSVNIVPCDVCTEESTCFSVLTESFKDCTCNCRAGGVSNACLPFDVPLAKTSADGVESCVNDVRITKSMTVASGQATVCFDAVVFSGPVTVRVELRAMDVFADVLNVTLRHCLLTGGAQLRIESVDEGTVSLLPRLHVNMTNVTSSEGTIVFRGVLPPNSSVLLANSTLSATVDGSLYVPTTAGQKSNKYGPALVLDGVRLLSAQFVMTRTTLTCGGDACAAILVEHGLSVNMLSAFYMDNCVVVSQRHVMLSLASDLSVGGGSVLSIQNNSWRVLSKEYNVGAMWFENVAVGGGSVLQFVSSTFHLGFAMLSMATLTVEDGSWLVHRDNQFYTAYVIYVRLYTKVQFRREAVWSILRNNFMPGAYTDNDAYMANYWSVSKEWSLIVYGMCNRVRGSPVTNYGKQLALYMRVTSLDCGVCNKFAMCFNKRTSDIKGCDCVCNEGGYGDTCLPAVVPDSLGPILLPPKNNDPVHCVHGGVATSIIYPVAGESTMCFVDVTFTAAITLDLAQFDASEPILNIRLLRCSFFNLTIKGNGVRAYVNVTSSVWRSGHFSLQGDFGPNSQISFMGNRIETTDLYGVEFTGVSLGVNTILLFMGNHITAEMFAIHFLQDIIVDGGGINIYGNRLKASEKVDGGVASVFFNVLNIKNGGYLDIESNEMSSSVGFLCVNFTVESKGLLRVANCTFVSNPDALFYVFACLFAGSGTFKGGAQWRVMNNSVKNAPLVLMAKELYTMTLEDSGTTAVFANNNQVDSAEVFSDLSSESLTLTSPAQFVVGCNQLNGVEATYGDIFPSSVTQFKCGSCNTNAACYSPGTTSVSVGSCQCNCKDGYYGASCLPFDISKIVIPPFPETPVDKETSCVVNQMLMSLTLNMWKTHHCYVGVVFGSRYAVMTFEFEKMPLHLPINITFSGCIFTDGAALHFIGSNDAVNSAGVLIRVDRTVMWSSVVLFSGALPQQCDIAVTGVDAVQSETVTLPDGGNNGFSVVSMLRLVLTASSLLISNVQMRSSDVVNSFGVYSTGALRLVDGSSLYVRYCNVKGYTHLMYSNSIDLSDHSVFALIDNTQISGVSIFYYDLSIQVRNFGVFRIVGNRGIVDYGIYFYNKWKIQESSWLDWRDNNVGEGAMFYHSQSSGLLNISNNSVVTLTGCKMGSTGLTGPMFKEINSGYKFVAGCLTIAGRAVTTADNLERNYITNVTRVAECGKCSKDSDCFDALTDEVKDCVCKCATGGYGDVCVPAPVPEGPPPPPPPPPPPLPPSFGECINDTMYPEVTQSVGSGLSWLCYRNVTFSGDFMRLTVAIGAMTGDVVNITFDGCRWSDGAVLLLLGSADAAVGSLSITITGNTFEDALLSPEGEFPPRTNIIISGNHFRVTKVVSSFQFRLLNPSCVAMSGLVVNNYSTVTLSGNTFQPVAASSLPICVGDGGLIVLWHSLFVVMSNTFIMEGKEGTPIFLMGSSSLPALNVRDNSAVVIQGNTVLREVTDFFKVYWRLHAETMSAIVLRRNSVQASNSVFCLDFHSFIYHDSWVRVSENLCLGQPSRGLTQFTLTLNMRNSTVAVSGNKIVSHKGTSSVLLIMEPLPDSTNGSIVLACNTLSDGNEAGYEIPLGYNVTVRGCGEPCTSETSCFPAYTTEALNINCSCTCAVEGYGDTCLPVDVPESPGYADLCVRDVTLNDAVKVGFGASVMCYVGVTFAADVVVDVSMMSGSVRNVTLTNCTMAASASLYVVGWSSDPPTGLRVDVWISGLVLRSGSGVLVANRYPPGSRVTVVDSTLMTQTSVSYRSGYDLGGVSACFVLYNLRLTGSVLTIARTQVVATFSDGVGLLAAGGVVLTSRGAFHVDRLLVQTAMGLCVLLDGSLTASEGSVVSFSDSDFLLCKHAVSVSGAVNVSASLVTFVRNTFASTQDNAVAFASTVSFADGSLLLMKGNVHDSLAREMLYTSNTVMVTGSTLSFVHNEVQFSRMLSVDLLLRTGAHVRVACNRVDGRTLTTAEDYAAAGFGKAESIDVVGCDTCDKNTYCYASGTSSASMKGGECVCVCNGEGHGEACVPVGIPALPPARGAVSTMFVQENVTLDSLFVVPKGAGEVTLRQVVLDGVHPVIYVPWMAGDGVRIVVQNVSLRNGAVLYVMGGIGVRRAGVAEGDDDGRAVELFVCGVKAVNGAIVLTGTFSAKSALTIADSLLLTSTSTQLVYLPDSEAGRYAPALVFWSLCLVQSVLLVSGVSFVSVVTGGRPVVADGAVLSLVGSGVTLDSIVFSGHVALHAGAPLMASDGSVLRVFKSQVYAAHGLVFNKGVSVSASAVVVFNNTGVLTRGALVTLQKPSLFMSGSWLSVRGNVVTGGLLSLPPHLGDAKFVSSTLTLHENTCSGPFVMQGAVAGEVGTRRKFVVGCLRFNEQILLPMEYKNAGIEGETHYVECGTCDTAVSCFAALTGSMSSCRCRCIEGGYGRECLPVYLPRVDGCNRTPMKPPTPTSTPSPSVTSYSFTYRAPTASETLSLSQSSSASSSVLLSVSPSVNDTPERLDVVCPALAVTTTTTGGRLTQRDIRQRGGALTRLLVALPSPFQWVGDVQLGKHLTFVLGSAVQPSGFSGPWGVMLRNAVWNRSATDPRSVLELEVPVYGGYFIGTDETIFIRGDAHAVSGGCNGELVGSFTIASNTPPLLLSALSVINGAVAGVTTVGVVVAGGLGSILEIQTLGVFAKMSCASVQERASSVALPYFLSVFAGLEDPLWMVVGNALIAAVFGCVHYGLTVMYERWRSVDVLGAWAAMRFPSLTYLVAYLMHLGIFFGSVFMMAMPNAHARHYVIGVAGVLYSVAFPVGVCFFIANHTGVSFTKYWQFAGKPFHERWLYPIGYWHPAAQQQMYSSIFTNMKGSYLYWCVFQLLVLCLVTIIAAVHPPTDRCHVLYFCMAAVLLAGAGVVAFTNMMRSAFLTVMHTTSFLLLAVLCLINAANYLSPNDGGVKAYAAIVLLLMTVLLAITVYSAVVWYVETLHWQSLREPRRGGLVELLNADTESDDNVQDSLNKTSSYASSSPDVLSYCPPMRPLKEHRDGSNEAPSPHPSFIVAKSHADITHSTAQRVCDSQSCVSSGTDLL